MSQLLIQPFVNYNLPHGWYLVSAPIITALGGQQRQHVDRAAGRGSGEAVQAGKQPINTQLQAFANVERPGFAADWQLRFQGQLLFPT